MILPRSEREKKMMGPLFMGPKTSRKKKDSKYPQRSNRFLHDVNLELDLKVDHAEEVKAKNFAQWMKSLFGNPEVEEDFEVIFVSEVILRGLKRIKFKNVGKVMVDEKEVYQAPEEWNDVEKVIDILGEYNEKIQGSISSVFMEVFDQKDSAGKVYIMRIHSKKLHAINVLFETILEKNLHKMVKHLKEHLEIEYINFDE